MLLKLIRRTSRNNGRRRYWDALQSEQWGQLRKEVVAETGGRCEACRSFALYNFTIGITERLAKRHAAMSNCCAHRVT